MNPVLVDSIRHRMREQTTEQLQELWVTNDRVTWSPEAFEAVKSLLAERGVKDLPAQNDPAPIVQTHSWIQDPVAQYWFAWLRPLLWIGIVLSALGLTQQAVGALVLWNTRGASAFRVHDFWDLAAGAVGTVLGPTWLMAGSIGCLRLKSAARTILLAYALTTVVLGILSIAYSVWVILWLRNDVFSPEQLLHVIVVNTTALVLPTILVLVLRRPEIRALFQRQGGPGFEPTALSTAA
jgi:hypothetical protein